MVPLETVRLTEVNERLQRSFSIQNDDESSKDIPISISMKFDAKDSSFSFVESL